MKKAGLILAVLLIFSFTPEKKYHLELNDTELNKLWIIIDNSAASHNDVKEIQILIQSQLKGQLIKDTTKEKK